jgi:hypothetical protein
MYTVTGRSTAMRASFKTASYFSTIRY